MWKYQNKIFRNQKELKAQIGMSGAKFRAKVRDGEIVRINKTGLEPNEITIQENT